jgi:hypothetical protein
MDALKSYFEQIEIVEAKLEDMFELIEGNE